MNKSESDLQHPLQPTYIDQDGIIRFKMNRICKYLLDAGPFDLNDLAKIPFTDEDWQQFAQLIGYSLGGWADLSYVSDEAYERARAATRSNR